MTEITEIDFLFGSDSDKGKVMPGLRRLKESGLIQPVVHYISADNNSETDVGLVIKRVKDRRREHEVYIGGAGFCNQLAGTLRKGARLQDLPVAVPISDIETDGVASFLSTTCKPPSNPLLTVGFNNTYAAGNIAYRFMQQGFRGVSVLRRSDNDMAADKIIEDLKKAGIKAVAGLHPDLNDVVVNPVGTYDNVGGMDALLMSEGGRGIQIAVSVNPISNFREYVHSLDDTDVTAMVNYSNSWANVVYAVAQVIQHKGALAELAQKRQTKAEHLRNLLPERI